MHEDLTRPSARLAERAESAADEISHVGPYRILGQLGRGGMGTVFLGERSGPKGFRKWFALKRPHAILGRDLLQLFYREARLAALVSHANVVSVVELRSVGGNPWLVMEYVRGPTLRQILNKARQGGEKLPVELACVIAAGAARGVRAIHDARTPEGEPCGIVHRDVSPSNFIVDSHGVARVLDFGIAARACDRERVTGKAAYMAPEVARGECDARSDVYSLGAVIWELLTQTQPGDARGVTELVARMLSVAPEKRPPLHEVVRALVRAARGATHEEVAAYLTATATWHEDDDSSSSASGSASGLRTIVCKPDFDLADGAE